MNRRVVVATIAVIALAAATISTTSRAATRPAAVVSQVNSFRSEGDGTFVTASAIVRIGPGAYLHTNEAHAAVGIESVEVNSQGALVITRDVPAGTKIASCIAEEDESVSALGIIAGCSGGSRVSTFWLTDVSTRKRVRVDDPMFGEYANLWILWVGFKPGAVS